MSLHLGELVGRVLLDDVEFQRSYVRVVRQMGELAKAGTDAAAGTDKLDEALAATGASATKAAGGIDKAAVAEQRAAAAASRHAQAMTQVGAIMARTATETPAMQAATLRLAAAQERLNTVQASGVATTRQLASAQAGLIAAQRSLARAEEGTAASAGVLAGRFGGLLKTARDLGLIIGAIEIVRKAFEFVGAGKELTDALNQVQAVSRATDGQMRAVRSTALALGRDLSIPAATAVDAANAIEELVKAGIALPRALLAARPALLLAAATQTNMADTARVLGDAMDIWSIKGEGAAHAAAILGSATLGASHNLVGLFDAIKQAGPSAQALNISLDDTATALVYLAKHGLGSEMGGTGLNVMFSTLAKDTPKGVQALKDLGVAAFDAQGRFVGFPKLFDQLHAAHERFGVDAHRFEHDLNAAFGVRAIKVTALFSKATGAEFDELRKHLEAGDLQKFADQVNRGFGAGARQLSKEATSAGIALYQHLEKPASSVIWWLGTNLPKAVHTAVTILGPLAHILGGAVATGWHLLGDALDVVQAVLGPVVHLLEAVRTPLGVLGAVAIAAYIGFRAFSAVPALMASVSAAVTGSAVTSTAAMAAIADEAAVMSGAIVADGEAAAAGWAGLLGPLGAVAVGVGLLVSMWHKSSTASKEATEAAKAYTEALKSGNDSDLADSIITQLANNNVPQKIADLNKALGSATFTGKQFFTAIKGGGQPLAELQDRLNAVVKAAQRTIVGLAPARQRGDSGAISAAHAANDRISRATALLTDLNTQYDTLTATAKKDLIDTKAFAGVSSSIDKVSVSTKVGSDTAKRYVQMLGIYVDKNGVAAVSASTLAAAVNTVGDAYNRSTEAGDKFLTALGSFSTSAGTANDRAALIGATLVAANGDALGFASALNGAATATQGFFSNVKESAKQAKKTTREYLASIVDMKTGTIEYGKAGAGPLISDLQSVQSAAMAAAQATYQHEKATHNGAYAADAAYKVYRSRTIGMFIDTKGRLTDQAKALGLTREEALKLSNQYFGMPKDIRTLIKAEGTDRIVNVLTKIGKMLAAFTGQSWDLNVNVKLNDKYKILGHPGHTSKDGVLSGPGYAAGGPINGPGPKGVDSKWLKGAPGEWMIPAPARDKYGDAFLRAITNLSYDPASGGGAVAAPSAGGSSQTNHIAGGLQVVLTTPVQQSVSEAIPMAVAAAEAALASRL